MNRYGFLIFGFCVSSCIGSDGLRTDAMSENNISNLSRISEGMTECEVVYVMGKPFDYQSFPVGDDLYDIWFYVTKPTVLGQTRMVHQNLTPLTFKNGYLVGWGYHFYDKALAQQRMQSQPKQPSDNQLPGRASEEDSDLERTLETPRTQSTQPNQKAAPPAKPKNQYNYGPIDKQQPQPPANPNQRANKPSSQKAAMARADDPDVQEQPEEGDVDDRGDRMLEDESEQDFNFW